MASISLSIRHHLSKDTEIKAIKFVTCCVVPPTKKEVLAYLGIPTYPGEKVDESLKGAKDKIKRMAETDVRSLILTLIVSVV